MQEIFDFSGHVEVGTDYFAGTVEVDPNGANEMSGDFGCFCRGKSMTELDIEINNPSAHDMAGAPNIPYSAIRVGEVLVDRKDASLVRGVLRVWGVKDIVFLLAGSKEEAANGQNGRDGHGIETKRPFHYIKVFKGLCLTVLV